MPELSLEEARFVLKGF
uniref:Uncharacterized protein n=1 Tax=Anguilla anguilla TaxID=7936 RepID=A0A0E9REJ0_ANGAN